MEKMEQIYLINKKADEKYQREQQEFLNERGITQEQFIQIKDKIITESFEVLRNHSKPCNSND